jgi:hypothetical protein
MFKNLLMFNNLLMFKKIYVVFLFIFFLFAAFPLVVFGNNSDGDTSYLDDLWILFVENTDSEEKADMLINFGKLGKGNQDIIDNVNNYLTEINYFFYSGMNVDYLMVSACIAAIMELGDSSSFPVLFNVLCVGYPEVIVSEAYGALDLLDGNLMQFLSEIIERNPANEKLAAFKAGINSQRLSISERGQIAELALELSFASSDDNADLTAMRYAAINALALFRWTRANSMAIRNYYRVLADYQDNSVSKDRLIEAVECLGAVGNSEAALVLGLQLGLINARTARTGIFDDEITLAIVQALGCIGYNAAFDHLLFTSNLSYSEIIKSAATDAINKLKW